MDYWAFFNLEVLTSLNENNIAIPVIRPSSYCFGVTLIIPFAAHLLLLLTNFGI